jgi:hypothetical protein
VGRTAMFNRLALREYHENQASSGFHPARHDLARVTCHPYSASAPASLPEPQPGTNTRPRWSTPRPGSSSRRAMSSE